MKVQVVLVSAIMALSCSATYRGQSMGGSNANATATIRESVKRTPSGLQNGRGPALPGVANFGVPRTAETLTVKPGKLAAWTTANWSAAMNASATSYPTKDLSQPMPRSKAAAQGLTFLKPTGNAPGANSSDPAFVGQAISDSPSLVPDSNNPAQYVTFIEEDSQKGICDGSNCSVGEVKASRYPTRRDHPEDWAAPEVVDVPKEEQSTVIPELKNDISCCGTYFDSYFGANRVDSIHPAATQPEAQLGVLKMIGNANYSKGTGKAPCLPCSMEVEKYGFDQWSPPEMKTTSTMRPEYKSDGVAKVAGPAAFLEEDTAPFVDGSGNTRPFAMPEPSGNFGSDFHSTLAGVAHRDALNQRMDYTKMRNMDGHVFNAADSKVKPVMHHVPEFADSLPMADRCNGCSDFPYTSPEMARCKECSKKNEPQEYYTPEMATSLRQ